MNSVKFSHSVFSFILYFVKKYKIYFFIYLILSFSAGFWGPINALLLRHIVNLLSFSSSNIISLIFYSFLIIINFIIFDNFTWRGLFYFKYQFLPYLLCDMNQAILDYTLRHSHQFFQQNMIGDIAKKINNLIENTRRMFDESISHFMRMISLILMDIIFVYQISFIFCLILIAWILIFFFASFHMSRKFIFLSEIKSNREDILSAKLVDSISNASSVNLFARREFELEARGESIENYIKSYKKKEYQAFCMHSIQGAMIAGMIFLVLSFLIYLYANRRIIVGDFILILGIFIEIGYMMWWTMGMVESFIDMYGKMKDSLRFLLIPILVYDKDGAKSLICNYGKIYFKDVYFHYDKTSDIFKNLSICIKPNEKVGLVGFSGAGKSTFINLIMRIYDIQKGDIFIDDQNISEVTLDSLHKNITVVSQDSSLFHRTLFENILYGRIDATPEEVYDAAKKAYIHDFIMSLPEQYNALVGDRGIKLSGGQRQRILIARAFLKNSKILIFDEATSQLDSVTEKYIQKSLESLMFNRTTIVIAHRLSTLFCMDRILVFEKGEIIEDGSHSELLLKNGMYKKLWDTQVNGFLGEEIFL